MREDSSVDAIHNSVRFLVMTSRSDKHQPQRQLLTAEEVRWLKQGGLLVVTPNQRQLSDDDMDPKG